MRNKNRLSLFPGLALTAMFGAGLLTMALPNQAAANTAAFNKITNTATVSYSDAGNNPQTPITATADVTVSLVRAIATLSNPADQATVTTGVATYNYTITANANGLDTYTLTTPTINQVNVSGSTVVVNGGVGTVNLGATTYVSQVDAGGKSTITVPNDAANDATVNGLIAGDKVVIGGLVYTVDSVNDAGGSTPGATSSITLTALLPVGTAVGAVIGEQYAFTMVVTQGTVTNPSLPASVTVDLTETAGATNSTDQTTTTFMAVALDVKKYVRNVTDSSKNPATADLTLNGADYYLAGVGGAPVTDTLEYVIAITHAAGAATAKNIIISDPIQAFTTYVAGSMLVSPAGGAWSAALTDVQTDADAGEFNTATKIVYIFAGSGGAGNNDGTFGNGLGGDLPGGTTTYGAFRVKID